MHAHVTPPPSSSPAGGKPAAGGSAAAKAPVPSGGGSKVSSAGPGGKRGDASGVPAGPAPSLWAVDPAGVVVSDADSSTSPPAPATGASNVIVYDLALPLRSPGGTGATAGDGIGVDMGRIVLTGPRMRAWLREMVTAYGVMPFVAPAVDPAALAVPAVVAPTPASAAPGKGDKKPVEEPAAVPPPPPPPPIPALPHLVLPTLVADPLSFADDGNWSTWARSPLATTAGAALPPRCVSSDATKALTDALLTAGCRAIAASERIAFTHTGVAEATFKRTPGGAAAPVMVRLHQLLTVSTATALARQAHTAHRTSGSGDNGWWLGVDASAIADVFSPAHGEGVWLSLAAGLGACAIVVDGADTPLASALATAANAV